MNTIEKTQSVPTYTVGNVTWDPSYGSQPPSIFRQLPALFNESWFDKVFGDIDHAFDIPNAVYPYNVVALKDKNGELTEYLIEVALAGVGKENIEVKVRDQKLLIDVSTSPTESDKKQTVLRKGISKRKGNLTFRLNEKVDAKKITSSYKDGLLTVTVPIVQPETIDVNIKVS